MKKYIKPVSKVVEIETNALLAGSLLMGDTPVEGRSALGKRNKDVDWDFEDEDF